MRNNYGEEWLTTPVMVWMCPPKNMCWKFDPQCNSVERVGPSERWLGQEGKVNEWMPLLQKWIDCERQNLAPFYNCSLCAFYLMTTQQEAPHWMMALQSWIFQPLELWQVNFYLLKITQSQVICYSSTECTDSHHKRKRQFFGGKALSRFYKIIRYNILECQP